ncbi:MAG: hypothetical protein M1840_005893 [Geoglossum simile]|nr:MAG: hypothetical protein M1840_005893 [Geoglossum simile]
METPGGRKRQRTCEEHDNAERGEPSAPTRGSPTSQGKAIKRCRCQPSRGNSQEVEYVSHQQADRTQKPATSPPRSIKSQSDPEQRQDAQAGDFQSKNDFIKAWLSTTDHERPLGVGNIALPPSDIESLTMPISAAVKDTASPSDPNFRKTLGCYNICIDRKVPAEELMRRVKDILEWPRLSPQIDEDSAQELESKSRKLGAGDRETAGWHFATLVIPEIVDVPSRQLVSVPDQLWTDSTPAPLDPVVTRKPLPLSKPKPGNVFGFSDEAFSREELDTIRLLINATPDGQAHFPFFDIEFKTIAKGGSHMTATNQAANAGAIVGHGLLELARRTSGLESIDYNEPHFFSLTMDHELAKIHMHWISADTENGRLSFHMERMSLYDLRTLDGLRAVQRAAKNILDWGQSKRLPQIRELLGAYRDKLQREEVSKAGWATTTALEGASVNAKLQNYGGSISTFTTIDEKLRPAPTLILSSALTLADFTPAPGFKRELGFRASETIEFANAKADERGWIIGRVKGGDGRWGRVPAGYLGLEN